MHAPPLDPASAAMRVLICPTAFKGSLGAVRAARAMEEGVRRALPGARCTPLPLSDGGPGLIESLESAGGRTAVVESADACGLDLLPPEARDPLTTHTRGVGELLLAAMDRKPVTLVVGLGGSATCDGGSGAARTFGYRFLDERGGELPDGGGSLIDLTDIRRPAGSSGNGDSSGAVPELLALADVNNPLLGPEGAAATYAPQKGAEPEGVERLESGMRRLVEVASQSAWRREPSRSRASRVTGAPKARAISRVPGGPRWVLRRVGFGDALEEADLVVTGEGAYDRTTERGKVVGEVIGRAREAGVPVRLVCGRIEGEPPPGVRGEDGGGRVLDAGGVAAVTERVLRADAPAGGD